MVSLALLLGCGDAGPPWSVVGRPSATTPRSIPLALDQLSRHARAGSFEIESGEPVSQLRFSIGVRGGDRATGPARFAVAAQRGEGWETVFEEVLRPGPRAWHDRVVDLPEGLRGASRFRFESSLEGADPALLLEAYFGSPVLLARREDTRPNVVFLLLDTLGASYLGHFGEFAGVSPSIDAFLADAYSFRRAYSQYGATLTSTTSLLTGLYPVHHGNYGGRASLMTRIDSLVEEFAATGYFTAAITEGGFVSSGWGTSAGFDWYDNGPPQQSTTAGFAPRTFPEAKRWLREHALDNRFFLVVHSYEVHAPYLPRTQAARAMIERVSARDTRPLPGRWQTNAMRSHNAGRGKISPQDLQRMKGHHLATVHELDEFVGGFLDELAALGLEDETLVVLLADHGDQFGERGKVGHGESLHNRVLHVPLGFRWPGRIEPGESPAPVQLVDVMPTVLELIGEPVPAGLDGRSLAPWILREPELPAPRAAFSELRGPNSECERLDLDRHCRLYRYSVQTERFKFVSSEVPPGEVLYDLDVDPAELQDVAAEHPEELARHRALLKAYLADGRVDEADAGEEQALDPTTRGRLQALGYIQ